MATEIRFSVSPSTIELLSRVAATATGGGSASDAKQEEMKDLSKLWDMRSYAEDDFWFTKTIEEASEVTESLEVERKASIGRQPVQEMCLISMPSIIVTLEAGVGNKTLPMLIVESSLKGNVNNWSTQLTVESSLTLQMNYYNSRLALWEPLIEPVEVTKENVTYWAPWELKLDVSMNDREEATTPTDTDSVDLAMQQAVMSIDVSSETNIELVVTKTCLEVLNNLGKAFADAMKVGETKAGDIEAPYRIVNELGCPVTVNLDNGSFSLYSEESTTEVILESSAAAALQRKIVDPNITAPGMKVATDSLQVKNYYLNVRVSNVF